LLIRYAVQYQGLTVYFAGDTGFDQRTLVEIGRLLNVRLDVRKRIFIPQIGEQVVVSGHVGEMAKKQ